MEVQQANDVREIHENYVQEIEDFKEVHKALMEHKKGGFSTKELKQDIKSMEGEKTSLVRRIQQSKKKVEDIPGCGPMLDLARELRKERDKEVSFFNIHFILYFGREKIIVIDSSGIIKYSNKIVILIDFNFYPELIIWI